MTVDELATSIMSRLTVEAGSNEWWETTEVRQYIKDLYREISRETKCLKGRDATIDSVAGTSRYVITKPSGVETILKISSVSYDDEKIDWITTTILDNNLYKWRTTLGNGTPFGVFFERGDENQAISFVPAPASVGTNNIAYEYAFVPAEPEDDDELREPLADGLILFDVVMSICLGKAGGGRDLDRSDWYFSNFTIKAQTLFEHPTTVIHVLGSIDDSEKTGLNLGAHYPKYTFD